MAIPYNYTHEHETFIKNDLMEDKTVYDPYREDSYIQNPLPYQPAYRRPAPKDEPASAPGVSGQYGQRPAPARSTGTPYQQQTMARPQTAQRLPQQPPARTQAATRKPNAAQQRMSKPDALALVSKLKRGIVVASLIGFSTLGGLALSHVSGATTQANHTTATQHTSSSTSSSNSSTSSNSSSSSNSSNSSSSTNSSSTSGSTSSGGTQFGSGSSSSPITTSSTS